MRISLFCAFISLNTLTLFNLQASPDQPQRKPNIVIFLTDDQGWGDLSIHGNKNLETPHIDRMARQGAQFENFYVSAVCAPTRAEFLTGRYYPKTGVSGVTSGKGRLNTDETTIADIFKSGGYATGCFGKWHNGSQPPYHPLDRGFNEFYGFTSGHWGHYFSPPLERNHKEIKGNGFVIDDFTDQAINFIEQHQEQPFFCYIAFNTPHSPFYVPDRHYKKFAGLDPVMRYHVPDKEDLLKTRAALALCENIDFNVGRVLKKLDELKRSEDTIVLYFSDNGPNSNRWNDAMKGRKGSIDEGGVRSPLFMYQPGHIAPRMIKTVTGAIDLLPTLVELAGLDLKTNHPIDGKSFVPLLKGREVDWVQRLLFSTKFAKGKIGPQSSVRSQQFRMDASGRLFDIEHDRQQSINVAEKFPEVAKSMKAELKRYTQKVTQQFRKTGDRPFTVGYGPITKLTARDGMASGTIKRSSKAANNSFFTNWTQTSDAITWPVDIGHTGKYEVILRYTCASKNTGAVMRLSQITGDMTEVTIKKAFDPPLYDKSKERVPAEKSHYFLKDFKAISMGMITLEKGQSTLKLEATRIPGIQAVDMISITLLRQN